MNLPASRHLDPRWNAALDALCAAWDAAGPDTTLAALKLLAEPETTAEGLVVVGVPAAARGAA